MKQILELINSYRVSEARSAFYYLSRYLKMADHFKDYKKDIFVDAGPSLPSEAEKELTLALVRLIEKIEGEEASKFSEDTFLNWMETIDEIESSLDPKPSEAIVKSGQATLENIIAPRIGEE